MGYKSTYIWVRTFLDLLYHDYYEPKYYYVVSFRESLLTLTFFVGMTPVLVLVWVLRRQSIWNDMHEGSLAFLIRIIVIEKMQRWNMLLIFSKYKLIVAQKYSCVLKQLKQMVQLVQIKIPCGLWSNKHFVLLLLFKPLYGIVTEQRTFYGHLTTSLKLTGCKSQTDID